jgi:SAM-dependent methyltransferase
MNNAWFDFYQDRVNDRYSDHIKKRYSFFLNVICAFANKNETLVELGCGIGSISKQLQKRVSNPLLLIDICPKMLELASQNVDNVTFKRADIIKDPIRIDKPILFHSHGVLEHFTDAQLESFLKNQGKTPAFHYVPSYKYETPSFGDERLMTPSQWDKLVKPDNIWEFNEGYDLILAWY